MNTLKPFTPTELAKLVDKRNLHLLIHGKGLPDGDDITDYQTVYAVHEFVHEHPGGDIVLLGEAGKDATKAWDDIEHSDEAKELMKRYLVGFCPNAESFPEPTELGKLSTQSDSKPQALLVFAVALVLAAALLAKML